MAAEQNARIEDLVASDIKKYKGVAVPVKASLLERIFVGTVNCSKLHPNWEDEFCSPEVGPSHEIIHEYEELFLESGRKILPPFSEPLVVEKMLPDGYLILNGHHRWAAAMRYGYRKVPVRIVNLTQEIDVVNMVEKSNRNKRVAIDLDSVVFMGKDAPEEAMEKKLPLISGMKFPERLKKGIPALFRFLTKHGYDIWLYTEEYYSMDYIKALFFRYHARVDGIVTGTARKGVNDPQIRARVGELIAAQYDETVNLDNEAIISIRGRKPESFDLNVPDAEWSKAVMDYIEKKEKLA